ncbi:MAG: hypothetical protein JNN15_09700 [Blastocatellia bacterium]|nr:hypothetical protein [Blastocatellia bacterium]
MVNSKKKKVTEKGTEEQLEKEQKDLDPASQNEIFAKEQMKLIKKKASRLDEQIDFGDFPEELWESILWMVDNGYEHMIEEYLVSGQAPAVAAEMISLILQEIGYRLSFLAKRQVDEEHFEQSENHAVPFALLFMAAVPEKDVNKIPTRLSTSMKPITEKKLVRRACGIGEGPTIFIDTHLYHADHPEWTRASSVRTYLKNWFGYLTNSAEKISPLTDEYQKTSVLSKPVAIADSIPEGYCLVIRVISAIIAGTEKDNLEMKLFGYDNDMEENELDDQEYDEFDDEDDEDEDDEFDDEDDEDDDEDDEFDDEDDEDEDDEFDDEDDDDDDDDDEDEDEDEDEDDEFDDEDDEDDDEDEDDEELADMEAAWSGLEEVIYSEFEAAGIENIPPIFVFNQPLEFWNVPRMAIILQKSLSLRMNLENALTELLMTGRLDEDSRPLLYISYHGQNQELDEIHIASYTDDGELKFFSHVWHIDREYDDPEEVSDLLIDIANQLNARLFVVDGLIEKKNDDDGQPIFFGPKDTSAREVSPGYLN